jgi:hypothetical protein
MRRSFDRFLFTGAGQAVTKQTWAIRYDAQAAVGSMSLEASVFFFFIREVQQ